MDIKSLSQFYDLNQLDDQLDAPWSPVEIARIGEWVLRAALFQGEYHWHAHDHDEAFLVLKGEIVIETEKGNLTLAAGQTAVIPKGLHHKPRSATRSIVLMLDPG